MNNETAAPITGAEIVVRCLAEEGVKHVFGYPGGAVLYIYDAIFKQDKFQHVLVRHEQAAVHAADAYSRSSNTVGVALVTSGPGVTNAVTGLSTAYMDSIPMVVISGQVPSHAIGQDAFQECDTVGITRPVVKHNFLVKDVQGPGLDDQESLLHRPHRPSRPRAGRYPEGHQHAQVRVRLSEGNRNALVQAGRQGPLGPDPQGGAAAAAGRTPDDLRRRRRDPGQRGARAEQAGRQARLPGHQHADGPGRLPLVVRQVGRHARHARHLRSEHGDAALRRPDRHRRPLRRPRDRQPEALRLASAQDHPRRHRPVVDFQARQGRHSDRRQRQGRADRIPRPARRRRSEGRTRRR